MTMADVELFLIVARTKSITKAAELLYISQPSVSQRLNALEAELGRPLVVRRKGSRQAELTREGAAFIPIAEQIAALWKEGKALRTKQDRLQLNVGCTDSVNVALLSPLYRRLLRGTPALDLNLRTHQSSELYGLLNTHDIDVAFVFYHLHYSNILTRLVFREKLYLVQSPRPPVPKPLVCTEELNPAMELFFKWNDPYQIWHDQWLTNYGRPHVAVDTIAMLDRLWEDERCWFIAPESVIDALASSRPIFVSQLKNPPPDRCCYQITHRSPLPSSSQALAYFDTQLDVYLRALRFEIPIGQVWQRGT